MWWGTLISLVSPEAGEHGGIEWFTPPFGHDGKTGLAWVILNFVVLLWILEKVLFKRLRQKQADKHDQVKGELTEATAARREAESVMREYEERLGKLDGEIDELIADAKQRAESDRDQIIAAAKKEAERIKNAASAAAERDAEARRKEIENEVVDRAVARAEKVLRSQLTPGDQRRMVDDYIGDLGKQQFGGGAP